jgi:hypothetical protein
MTTPLWTPISFTALPLGSYEAIYLAGEDFVRHPVIGVLIEEQVKLDSEGAMVRTGVTRAVMAQQPEPGVRYIEAAGGSTDFVGVYQAGEEPADEFLERARRATNGS